jgi:CO/xanthine dehydrogenase FAD-binding subunit
LDILQQHPDQAKILAGGQSLIPLSKPHRRKTPCAACW